jgi:hypothetical protein
VAAQKKGKTGPSSSEHGDALLEYWEDLVTTAGAGAVVAHREQWWLIGSSGGSFVVTPDCETAVLGSNPAISPVYSGLPVLRWAAIWDSTSL